MRCFTGPASTSVRCGVSWTDANSKCGGSCATNADCAVPGEACYAHLSTVPCSGAANPSPAPASTPSGHGASSSTRCGTTWTDAVSKCGGSCATDADCSVQGEACFAHLSTSPCGGGPPPSPASGSSSTRCGATWTEANSKCGGRCAADADCGLPGEACYAHLSTAPCSSSTPAPTPSPTPAPTSSPTPNNMTSAPRCGPEFPGSLCPTESPCCSVDGFCGFGDDFCGEGNCQSGACDIIPETPYGVCGSEFPGIICPEEAPCCSQWGFCGSGQEYCGDGCQGGCPTDKDEQEVTLSLKGAAVLGGYVRGADPQLDHLLDTLPADGAASPEQDQEIRFRLMDVMSGEGSLARLQHLVLTSPTFRLYQRSLAAGECL